MKLTNIALLTTLIPALVMAPEHALAHYDPAMQRWINRDPSAEEGGINLYSYTHCDPINLVDPFGQCPLLLAIPIILEGLGISTETGVLLAGGVAAAGAGYGVGTIVTGHGASQGSTIAPPTGLSVVNAPPITIVGPFPITVHMGKGERGWERGRGDDPYWDLSPEDLRKIENDPKSTPSQKERARRIRKQKEKDCS